jgi:hypothetical protein
LNSVHIYRRGYREALYERHLTVCRARAGGHLFQEAARGARAACVFPTVFLTQVISSLFGRPAILTEYPKVLAYYQQVQQDPVIQRILGEMTAAMKAAGHSQ